MTKQVVKAFDADQLKLIVASVQGIDKANKAVEQANEKRTGSYATFTLLATEMGQEDFAQCMESLFADIRVNKGGIARKVKAPANDKGDAWKIPSAMSSAKSVLLTAYEFGVPMLDEETDQPRPFGTIRKEANAAKKSEAQAERTLQEIERDQLADHLREFAGSIASEEPDLAMAASYRKLEAMLDAWTVEHAAISGADEEEVEALKGAIEEVNAEQAAVANAA